MSFAQLLQNFLTSRLGQCLLYSLHLWTGLLDSSCVRAYVSACMKAYFTQHTASKFTHAVTNDRTLFPCNSIPLCLSIILCSLADGLLCRSLLAVVKSASGTMAYRLALTHSFSIHWLLDHVAVLIGALRNLYTPSIMVPLIYAPSTLCRGFTFSTSLPRLLSLLLITAVLVGWGGI